MFLQPDHFQFEIFQKTKALVLETYKVSKLFPSEEKFALTQQVRRAAFSVHLNLSEGFTRRSKSERKRFFEISRGSVVEIDTAFDVSVELMYLKNSELVELGKCIISCFSQLSALIKSTG